MVGSIPVGRPIDMIYTNGCKHYEMVVTPENWQARLHWHLLTCCNYRRPSMRLR